MDLTRSFTPEQYARALESWDWADLAEKVPVFTSPFGDVFFKAADGFWFLDLVEGTLTLTWPTAAELTADLNTAEGQDRYLLAGLAWAAERQGVSASGDKVLGFAIAPILGGSVSADNLEVIDFVVSVHLAGQLHRQVRDLPDGTRISQVTLTPSEDGPTADG